jgi:hypothetical protein
MVGHGDTASVVPSGRPGAIAENTTRGDAQLIAAAPDLLAVCELIEAHLTVNERDTVAERVAMLRQIRAEIARAKGKSK